METYGITPLIDTTQTYLFTYDGKLIQSLPDRSGFIVYNSENVSNVVKNPFYDDSNDNKNTDTSIGVNQLNSSLSVTFCSRNNTNITNGIGELDHIGSYTNFTETNDRNIDRNTTRDVGRLVSSFPVISNENEFNDMHRNRNITIYEDVHNYPYYLDQLDVYRIFDEAHISIQLSKSVVLVDDFDNDLVELESMGNPTTRM